MRSDDPAILHIAPSDPAYTDPRIAASELFPMSSTEVRRAVAMGQTTEGMIPAAVRAYIDRLGLYRPSFQEG